MITLIAAISDNNVIGSTNKIPWHLPRDFKHFKETTLHHPIVMGRKTYESIGRPLPERENIILTRQNINPEGYTVVQSIEDILERSKEQNLFVIGGAEIYKQFLPYADKLILTRVKAEVAGDIYFPEIKMTDWKLVSSEDFPKDERNVFDMVVEKYERK